MAKKSGFVEEFKKFISRGNVMDLAVGIIIGSAFTAIVKSLVNDIIMPIVGMVLGGVNFTHLRVVIRKATLTRPELALTYGNFIQNVVDFLLVALVVFFIVRSFNRFKELREQADKEKIAAEATSQSAPEPAVPADIALLTEIRDLLRKD